LGDFSDYRRAKVRTHLPVWLTREEIRRLFACLDERTRLMAQVMYGSGLRLMELLRLRVKDLDLDQGNHTESHGNQSVPPGERIDCWVVPV
jgi:integrase